MKNIKNFGYQLIRPLLKIFIVITLNPKTIHKERIPKKGGFILAGTHVSYYDPIIVGNSTFRSVHFLAKKELFDNKILGTILRFMGIISVDRKKSSNPEAKKLAIDTLTDGNVVCVFPEGTRNRANDLILPFKYGAVSFAKKSGCPIVPFAIVPRPKTFKYKTKLIIGKPFYVKSDDLEKENIKLEKKVIDLINEGKKIENVELKIKN